MKEGIKFKVIYSPKPDSVHFLFQADTYTLKGDVAYIDKPALNGNPGAQILASMCENPSGVYNKSEIGFKYDWDFNTDGMAHYGLMPDFLQDLRNIGLTPMQLTYLFRSAEDYIQMWEKTEKASKRTSPN